MATPGAYGDSAVSRVDMLRTRLWMGAILVVLAVGVLVVGKYSHGKCRTAYSPASLAGSVGMFSAYAFVE